LLQICLAQSLLVLAQGLAQPAKCNYGDWVAVEEKNTQSKSPANYSATQNKKAMALRQGFLH
jgi:hypothetical protein